MKKARDIHRLLERVDLTINTDADKAVLDRVLSASRKSASPVSPGESRRTLVVAELWWRFAFWRIVGCVVVVLLVVSSWIAVDSHREISNLKVELEQAETRARQDIPPMQPDETTTINLYLQEYQDVVARYASRTQTASQPVQMRVNRQDILYYEFLVDGPEYMAPGIIVRGPSTQLQNGSRKAPIISNGHTLSLSEARQEAGFGLVVSSWLHPGYVLDEIRRIDGHDALQLIYTDGFNSVSLFEQHLNGQQGLSREDFREYAVYCRQEQGSGTILAWRDDALSYVLIGNAEMSQLMDMAQSISAER